MSIRIKNLHKDDSVILNLLSLMETDNNITQRNIARDLNIALGLTNLYIKKCIDKGLLKINQIPSKRYKYYITKKGFMEKARLTQEYFKASFNMYREAKEELIHIFEAIDKGNPLKIVLSDISEIADIAILTSVDYQIKIVGILDSNNKDKYYKKIPIISNLRRVKDYDYIILTSLLEQEILLKELSKTIQSKQLIIPTFLKLKTKRNKK